MKQVMTRRVSFCLSRRLNLAETIYNKVGVIGGFTWDVPENWQKVEQIINKDKCDRVIRISNSAERNREIRKLISPYLRNGNKNQKRELADWIIYIWGRITRGRESSSEWTELLGDYSDKIVSKFVNDKGNDRIASWSKLLAFSYLENYAVYDAWVALALNSILDDIGFKERFFMPPPRVEKLKRLVSRMKDYVGERYKGKTPIYMGYSDYMELLKDIANKTDAIDVLDVEMCIFANADSHCRRYANKHNIDYS